VERQQLIAWQRQHSLGVALGIDELHFQVSPAGIDAHDRADIARPQAFTGQRLKQHRLAVQQTIKVMYGLLALS
jgi:hypothetical protein